MRPYRQVFVGLLSFGLWVSTLGAEGPATNTWVQVADERTGGTIGALVYCPEQQGLLLYGYPAPASSSDVELFVTGKRAWESQAPKGAHLSRGSGFTVWNDGRPQLPWINRVYWLANQSCYVPSVKKVLYFAGGSTFYFDPAQKKWEDLKIPLDRAPPDVMLGSMAWDSVKQRVILFGGGYISAFKGSGDTKVSPLGKAWTPARWTMEEKRATWTFDPQKNVWNTVVTGSEKIRALHTRAWHLYDVKVIDLLAAIRPLALEYAEAIHGLKAPEVGAAAQKLCDEVTALNAELAAGGGSSDAYEAAQCKASAAEGEKVLAELQAAKAALAANDAWKALWIVEKARWQLFDASECIAPSPLPRYYAGLVTDTQNKVLVLFGGHGGDKRLGDTWVFDPAKDQWRRSRSAAHPPAQELVGLSYDSRAGVAVMPSGWLYDAARDEWKTLKLAGGEKLFHPWVSLAYDPQADVHVLLTTPHGTYGEFGPRRTALLKLDATKAQPASAGGRTWSWLEGKYDASWAKLPKTQAEFSDRVAAQQKFLDELPPNTWVKRNAPYDCQDRSYGSFCYDWDRAQLVNWGGGHSAYMGNEISHYDIKANLWLESWAPDLPPWPFGAPDGDGWNPPLYHRMGSAHGYHKYAYCSDLKKVIFVGHNLQYDPDGLRFDAETVKRNGEGGLGMAVDMCGSPGFLSATAQYHYGAPFGVWKADFASSTFTRLPGSDPAFGSNDRCKPVFDSKRKRVLWYGVKSGRNQVCDELWACPLESSKWEKLNFTSVPEGAKPAAMGNWGNCYSAKYDCMLILPGGKGQGLWIFDCAQNTMRRLGDEPKVAQTTSGIVYDIKHDVFIALEAGSYGTGPVSMHFFRYKP